MLVPKADALTEEEIRNVYRLLMEVRELWADRIAWQTRLLEGVRAMLDLRIAVLQMVCPPRRRIDAPVIIPLHDTGWNDSGQRQLYLDSIDPRSEVELPSFSRVLHDDVTTGCVAFTRRMVVHDDVWYPSRFFTEFVRPSGNDEFALSMRASSTLGSVVMIGGNREHGAEPIPMHTVRQLALLAEEVVPLMGRHLTLEHQIGFEGLSPRQRQTLELLLEGLSEKQVAHEMGLRRPTVHDYIVTLYRHFDVSSRAELLSYFVQRKPKDRAV